MEDRNRDLVNGAFDDGAPGTGDGGGVANGNRYSNLRDSDPYTGISGQPNYRPAGPDPLNFHSALSPRIDSNLPPAARTYMSSNLRIFSIAMGVGLAQAFGDELAAGTAVVMHATLSGLHGQAGDERKPEERTLDVRFVMNGAGDSGAAGDGGR